MSLSKLIDTYEAFVCESSWFVPFLDTAKNFVVFLPNRFSDTELSGELIYSSLAILTHYHDGLLGRPRIHRTEVKLSGQPSTIGNPPSKTVRLMNGLLFVFSAGETLMELLSMSFFRNRSLDAYQQDIRLAIGTREKALVQTAFEQKMCTLRWKIILLIESVKAAIRLFFLVLNKGRMLLSPSASDVLVDQHQRNVATALRKLKAENATNSSSSPSSSSSATPESKEDPSLRLLRASYLSHGRSCIPHGQFSPHSAEPVHPSETDAKPVSFARVLSEVLYWCRPVVYAFLRLVSPENSWTPFFGSILVDIIARKLAGDLRDLSPAQVEQWAVRTRGYLYYLVRSPLFETVTIRPFKAAADMLAPLPLVGSVLSVVVETAIALQRHHFYTSNS